MPVNKAVVASITQYAETILPNGEIQITGRDGATQLSQTLATGDVLGVILYDPSITSFRFVPLDFAPGEQFVSLVQSVTTAAKVG